MTKKKVTSKKKESKSNTSENNKETGKINETSKNDKNQKFFQKGKNVLYKDGDYFEMENLVDHKTEKGKLLYFIKWLDWNEDSNTWEPIENIFSHCLISDYEKTRQNKPYTIEEEIQRDKRLEELKDLENYEIKMELLEVPRGNLQSDNPHSVIGFINKDLIKVQWIIRHRTGVKPEDSLVNYRKFREKHPHLLIKFYEDCIFYRKENIFSQQ